MFFSFTSYRVIYNNANPHTFVDMASSAKQTILECFEKNGEKNINLLKKWTKAEGIQRKRPFEYGL